MPDTENEARNSRHSPYPHAGNRPERGGPSARRIRFGRGGFLRFGRRTHRKARLRPELARAILQKKAFADAEREVKHCRKHGIEIIASTDAQYPALLRETADYPHVLYVLGSPEALGKTTLTMVGTRRMTPYGQQMADRLIGELADRVADTVIVSGLAFGIDTACHRAALAFGMRPSASSPRPFPASRPHSTRPSPGI